MPVRPGDTVRHVEFGIGEVLEVLGGQSVVSFFGDRLTVPSGSLRKQQERIPEIQVGPTDSGRVLFRRSYEAINLGVVPPHPDQLLRMSIGGDRLAEDVHRWLENAPRKGLCKVIFGDYGSGKSHHLRVVEAAALKAGWAVSFVEFDPKQADPAKPHLVYRAIMGGLRFPARVDGSRSRNFYDLVGDVRRQWDVVRTGQVFKESPWFDDAMGVLRFHSHSEEPAYVDGVNWLAGQVPHHSAITNLARQAGGRAKAPRRMPKMLDTAEIYVQHLAVVNEWCRALGYKGLLILLDEAEHVRSFNVNRRDRANNFFDLLARAAHPPTERLPEPLRNEHGIALPAFWKHGPHFSVIVALTEGSTFADPQIDVRDACVFLHSKADIVRLDPPSPADYERWCTAFFQDFEAAYPEKAALLKEPRVRRALASGLTEEYSNQPAPERTLRVWVKAASLVPSLLLGTEFSSAEKLGTLIRTMARQAAGHVLPWEM